MSVLDCHSYSGDGDNITRHSHVFGLVALTQVACSYSRITMHSEDFIHNRCHFKLSSDFFSPQSILQSQTCTHKARDLPSQHGHTFELRTLAQVTFVTTAKYSKDSRSLGPWVQCL